VLRDRALLLALIASSTSLYNSFILAQVTGSANADLSRNF